MMTQICGYNFKMAIDNTEMKWCGCWSKTLFTIIAHNSLLIGALPRSYWTLCSISSVFHLHPLLTAAQPTNYFKAINEGSCKACLACFPSPRNHCPSFPGVQWLENRCLCILFFVVVSGRMVSLKWSLKKYSTKNISFTHTKLLNPIETYMSETCIICFNHLLCFSFLSIGCQMFSPPFL